MKFSRILVPATLCTVVAIASACGARQTPHSVFAAAAPAASAAKTAKAELGRAQLWAAHCTRCHNLRPNAEYSPAQWSVVVSHMRTVADLPGEDYRGLLEYLADRAPARQAPPKPLVASTNVPPSP